MKLIYISLTGNVREFIKKVGMDNQEIGYLHLFEIEEPYIVVVPTYDDDITDMVSNFVDYKNNREHLIGFVGSGNRNFDNEFCFNAKDLSKKYNKPLIFTFEFSGMEHDIIKFKEEVRKIGIARTKKEN